jgi:peroxiredoxin Q/BCP
MIHNFDNSMLRGVAEPCKAAIIFLLIASSFFLPTNLQAEVAASQRGIAPIFSAKNQEGVVFNLESRKGVGYTVLFFYPKAGTPGCTKQACAFRDAVKVIRNLGAEVYGISADSVAAQKKFHDEHKMTFDLLSDEDAKVISLYGVKMPVLSMAKRQTFVLDKDLVVRKHYEDVDPAIDAKNVAADIAAIQADAARMGQQPKQSKTPVK